MTREEALKAFAAIMAKSASQDGAWANRLAEQLLAREAKPMETGDGNVDLAALAPKSGPCGAC